MTARVPYFFFNPIGRGFSNIDPNCNINDHENRFFSFRSQRIAKVARVVKIYFINPIDMTLGNAIVFIQNYSRLTFKEKWTFCGSILLGSLFMALVVKSVLTLFLLFTVTKVPLLKLFFACLTLPLPLMLMFQICYIFWLLYSALIKHESPAEALLVVQFYRIKNPERTLFLRSLQADQIKTLFRHFTHGARVEICCYLEPEIIKNLCEKLEPSEYPDLFSSLTLVQVASLFEWMLPDLRTKFLTSLHEEQKVRMLSALANHYKLGLKDVCSHLEYDAMDAYLKMLGKCEKSPFFIAIAQTERFSTFDVSQISALCQDLSIKRLCYAGFLRLAAEVRAQIFPALTDTQLQELCRDVPNEEVAKCVRAMLRENVQNDRFHKLCQFLSKDQIYASFQLLGQSAQFERLIEAIPEDALKNVCSLLGTEEEIVCYFDLTTKKTAKKFFQALSLDGQQKLISKKGRGVVSEKVQLGVAFDPRFSS